MIQATWCFRRQRSVRSSHWAMALRDEASGRSRGGAIEGALRFDADRRSSTDACTASIAHWNIGGPTVAIPYLVAIPSMTSNAGNSPGGVAADSSMNRLQKLPGVVAMRSRASEFVKF